MSDKSKGHPTFDHMPPELSKAIAAQAKQQAKVTSQSASTAATAAIQNSGGSEKPKK